MNSSYPSDHDRMLELLADQAISGLTAVERIELKSLMEANPDFDLAALDRTAAMLDISASVDDIEPLPDHLRDRILAQDQSESETMCTRPHVAQVRNDMRWREVVAWMTAAACLLLAVFAWSRWPTNNLPLVPSPNPSVLVGKDPLPPRPSDDDVVRPNAKPTISQLREQLLNSAPDVLLLQLVSDNGGGVSGESGGDIVWSSGRQIGYLRLKGLVDDKPVQQRQYQLWIVGSDVSGNEIINGGIFAVNPNKGELILPIQAGQFVQQPKMFVVSVEPLGGGDALTTSLLAKADGLGP
jgi:anti-sigma-K factor RskA